MNIFFLGEVLKMEATSCSSEAYAMEKDELNTQSKSLLL